MDWVGISVYGRLYANVPLSPFAAKLDGSGVYRTMAKLSRRPFAIAEMGVAGDAAWIRAAFAAIRSGRYPRIRAATWWNMDTAGIDTFSASLRFSSSCR